MSKKSVLGEKARLDLILDQIQVNRSKDVFGPSVSLVRLSDFKVIFKFGLEDIEGYYSHREVNEINGEPVIAIYLESIFGANRFGQFDHD